MSVIAKLSIVKVTRFGTGTHVALNCVCANDLMAAYAESEEDRLFTRYSPWGEMTINQPDGFALGREGDVFYALILRDGEPMKVLGPEDYFGPFPGSYASCGASAAA